MAPKILLLLLLIKYLPYPISTPIMHSIRTWFFYPNTRPPSIACLQAPLRNPLAQQQQQQQPRQTTGVKSLSWLHCHWTVSLHCVLSHTLQQGMRLTPPGVVYALGCTVSLICTAAACSSAYLLAHSTTVEFHTEGDFIAVLKTSLPFLSLFYLFKWMAQEQSNHGNWKYYKNYQKSDKNIFLIASSVNFLKLIHQLHLKNLLLQNDSGPLCSHLLIRKTDRSTLIAIILC